MMPYSEKFGIAFIDSQGFMSEYGTALAQVSNKQSQAALDYTDNFVPIHKANLANLTDCDASGVNIGIKIAGSVRLGIDLNTIQEIIDANPGNKEVKKKLTFENLQENIDTTKNTHYKALVGLLKYRGKLYDSLIKEPDGKNIIEQARLNKTYIPQRKW